MRIKNDAAARRYSLAHLSALPLPPPDLVELAAQAGYDHVGVRLLPPAPHIAAYPLMNDAVMRRETLARLADSEVTVFDIEVVKLTPEFDVRHLSAFLDTGAELGARAVLVAAGDEPDHLRLAHHYAAFCEAAAPFGMTANIEFMPWTPVSNLSCAQRLLTEAGHPANARILVDTIHWARSGASLDELAAVPSDWLAYVQLCDAHAQMPDSMEEILRQARYERLLPGEGGIDLRGFLAAIPRALPVAVECWHAIQTPAMGYLDWARTALQAARALDAPPPIHHLKEQ